MSYTGEYFYKCSVDSESGLLAMICNDGDDRQCVCVDLSSKSVIFKTSASGIHTQHWIVNNGYKCLSVATKENIISLFRFDNEKKTFAEDLSFRICLGARDSISYSEFDSDYQHIFILKNEKVLEKRNMRAVDKVLLSVELEEKVTNASTKQLTLSQDGNFARSEEEGGILCM